MELDPGSFKGLLERDALFIWDCTRCHVASGNVHHDEHCNALGALFALTSLEEHANLVHLQPQNISLNLGVELSGSVQVARCIALLDGMDLAVWTVKVLNCRLNCLVASSLLEHFEKNIFARMTKISMKSVGGADSFTAMNFSKLSKDTSEGFVFFVVDGVDLFIEAFMKKKSTSKCCCQLCLVVLCLLASVPSFEALVNMLSIAPFGHQVEHCPFCGLRFGGLLDGQE